jgi:NADPH:quinone reductase-like Zn-dependent oxidoreductase
MRAVFVTRFGPPEVLQIREIPLPSPNDNEIRVRVHTIGMNFAEVFARLGVYPSIPKPPFIPGLEFSGYIDAVGKSTSGFSMGDRVLGFTRQGAYAEYVCVPPTNVKLIPHEMSLEEAAAIGVTYLTAYHAMVTLANIRKGDKILVHAAAGGVGTAALQLAKHYSAIAYGTVGSDWKAQTALTQGAAHVINYTTTDFETEIRNLTNDGGVDIVLDAVGGDVFRKSWRLLAPMGRYILYGFASASGKRRVNYLKAVREILRTPILFPQSMLSKNVGLHAFNIYFLTHKIEYLDSVAKELFRLYEEKVIKPVIGKVFPFDRIADAQAFLQSRQSIGKVVVTI